MSNMEKHPNTNGEMLIEAMRQKFMTLKAQMVKEEEEEEGKEGRSGGEIESSTRRRVGGEIKASKRWAMLQKSITKQEIPLSPDDISSVRKKAETSDLDDINDLTSKATQRDPSSIHDKKIIDNIDVDSPSKALVYPSPNSQARLVRKPSLVLRNSQKMMSSSALSDEMHDQDQLNAASLLISSPNDSFSSSSSSLNKPRRHSLMKRHGSSASLLRQQSSLLNVPSSSSQAALELAFSTRDFANSAKSEAYSPMLKHTMAWSDDDDDDNRDSNTKLDPEEEEARLQKFWSKLSEGIPPPPIQYSLPIEDIYAPPEPPPYEEEFKEETETVGINIHRVPESVVQTQRKKMETVMLQERRKVIDSVKSKEIDILWREHLARLRVENLEKESKLRIENEKAKFVTSASEKEKLLSRNFRRAREELEASLKRQEGVIRERYGRIQIGDVQGVSMHRELTVKTSYLPQPLEIRIHILRAIKTKLPKGVYVLMVSCYDSLGGKPLTWSKVSEYGIGPDMPSVTRKVKHYGRFFDRVLKVEDSCFAMCPPREKLKPSFCLVFELFRLASHANPYDTIVGWTAIPMCNEHMGLIEGKFKLPILRGEHSPATQHYRTMEQAIAHDLQNWLCNIYFEVRRLPLVAVDPVPSYNDGSIGKGIETGQVGFDYINKHAHPTYHVSKMATLATEKSRSGSGSRSNLRQHDIESGSVEMMVSSTHFTSQNSTVNDDDYESRKLSLDQGLFHRKPTPSNPLPFNHHDLSVGEKEKGSKKWTSVVNSILGFFNMAPTPSRQLLRDADSNKSTRSSSSNSNKYLPQKNEAPEDEIPLISGQGLQDMSTSNDNITNVQGIISKDVLERGYNSEDEFLLPDASRGKLAGIEILDDTDERKLAEANLEGKIVRRWQSEGLRLDSEALDLTKQGGEKDEGQNTLTTGGTEGLHHQHKNEKGDMSILQTQQPLTHSIWQPLDDPAEMDEYNMAIYHDPSQRRRIVPNMMSKTKLRYLYLEAFGDLAPHMWGGLEFYITVFVFLFAAWLRLYVHFLIQFLYLVGGKVPLSNFKLDALTVTFKYVSASVPTSTEVGIVAIGPIANIAVFLFFVILAQLFYKLAGFLPESCSKFVASYGVVTVLDPLLILIVDLCYHNYNCSVIRGCEMTYASPSCNCFYGDFVKLWERTARDEGSGISGAFITLILYVGTMSLSCVILYMYLVHVHKDSRILDIWRRIHAHAEEFFIPDDFEINREELISICARASVWRSPDGSIRKVEISEIPEESGVDLAGNDHFTGDGSGARRTVKHYAIFELSPDKKKRVIYRHFLCLPSGQIIEIFDRHSHVVGFRVTQTTLGPLFQDDNNANPNQISSSPSIPSITPHAPNQPLESANLEV